MSHVKVFPIQDPVTDLEYTVSKDELGDPFIDVDHRVGQILELDGILEVRVKPHSISILKDEEADWDELEPKIEEILEVEVPAVDEDYNIKMFLESLNIRGEESISVLEM